MAACGQTAEGQGMTCSESWTQCDAKQCKYSRISVCCAQELQPSKDSDDEGTDDGKQRDKKRKEVSPGCLAENVMHCSETDV